MGSARPAQRETMHLLLTSAFGMRWESGDKSFEQTGTVARNEAEVLYEHAFNVLANRDDNWESPGCIVLECVLQGCMINWTEKEEIMSMVHLKPTKSMKYAQTVPIHK